MAGVGQRDLQACAAEYGGLFAAAPFDPALFSTVALANAFCAPWLTADQLRVTNRSALWVFALDWMVDYLATTRAQVDDIVMRCLAVADGAPAESDPLTRFLADIRDSMTGSSAFPWLHPIWCEQLRRVLQAMAREWVWRSTRDNCVRGASPTIDEYLANADNLGFTFVYLSHWIFTVEPGPIERVDELLAAGAEVQRLLRLVNDVCTYRRDLSWGDLNALMLGVTEAQVRQRITELTKSSRALLRPLRRTHWQLASYLDRQIGFNMGFHPIVDYWGRL
jgi:hypothetical protein